MTVNNNVVTDRGLDNDVSNFIGLRLKEKSDESPKSKSAGSSVSLSFIALYTSSYFYRLNTFISDGDVFST